MNSRKYLSLGGIGEEGEGVISGGAYQLKVEPFADILTVLSGLVELNKKLEMLDFERKEEKELTYVL